MSVRPFRLLVTVAWGAMMIAATAGAQTAPSGGEVRAGDATISPTGSGLLITQGSDRAVIDWNSFSVGQGGVVDFRNGDGATLNRVTGDSISRIDGRLTASGSVYVMNANGVIIGRTGVVDVGGTFVASSLDVTDADFMNAGDLLFSGDSDASVINFGRIGALGGDVALIGARVENRGTIVAADGTAALAAGYEVLMRDAALADGQFVVRLGGEGTQALNAGRIEAAAVELRANQGNVLALAGNTEGMIRAEGIATESGRIFLTAPGGQVRVEAPVVAPAGEVILNARDITINGLVDVSATGAPGGSITAEAETLYLSSAATLDASGTTGGLIRVGGDLQGGLVPGFGDPMQNATDVAVAAGARILADGSVGQGGDIVLWADESMVFRGAISATGTGDATGGFAEVSGGFLLFDGTADLRSDRGDWGELLLDPFNITISNSPSAGMVGFTAGANNSILNATTLLNALATANVNVFTGNNGAQAGNITVSVPLSWTSSGRLTLTAANNIAINRAITARSGGLILNAGGTITVPSAVNVGFFNLVNGFWRQEVTGTLPDFSARDFRVSDAALFRRWEVVQSEGTLNTVIDIYGLQGLRGEELSADDTIFIFDTIDATGTANWNNGAGFLPIGTAANPFLAGISGYDAYIVGLTINRPTSDNVGLIGYSQGGYVSYVGIVDANIIGRNNVGAFYGFLQSGGQFCAECPAGLNLYRSWATGTVEATGQRAGGLIGLGRDPSVRESWARVDVRAVTNAGGLAGEATFLDIGAFSEGFDVTYALGSVTATGSGGIAGGLIGTLRGVGFMYEFPNIFRSYATGRVTGTIAGGLVGVNDGGTGDYLYWDRQTTGRTIAVGDSLTENDLVSDIAISMTSAQARDASFYDPMFLGFEYFATDSLRPMIRYIDVGVIFVPEQLQLLADNEFLFYGSPDSRLGRDLFLTPILSNPAGIWGPRGWLPIGDAFMPYTGNFDGDGHTIDGLFIDRSSFDLVGLFGAVAPFDEEFFLDAAVDAQIANLRLTNVNIVGGTIAAGALAGELIDSSAAQIFVTGSVRGLGSVGGIVGSLDFSTLYNAASTASVTGTLNVGGLVGEALSSDIFYSYALGPVSGQTRTGGLVGFANGGTELVQTFATGRVTGTGVIGGLVGRNEGSILASFWDRDSTTRTNPFGQNTAGAQEATSLATAQFQDTSFFLSFASGFGWDFVNDWAPPAPGFYPANYLIEPVVYLAAPSIGRTYGASNGGLTVGGTLSGGPVTYIFGPSDDAFANLSASILAPFGPTTPVGFYRFGNTAGLTSIEGQSYRLVSVAGLNITPAPLRLGIDDITRIYGDPDPELTFLLTGFVNGEGSELVTGTLTRAPGEDVGSYTISLGTLSAGSNYTISVTSAGSFVITPRSLTIAADDLTMIFGEDVPPLTFTIVDGQLVFDDEIMGALATGAIDEAGLYAILLGSLTAGGNYIITFLPGTLTVLDDSAPPPPPPPPPRPSAPFERSTDSFIPVDFDIDTLSDPFFAPDPGNTVGPIFSTESTDAVIDQLEQATAYCSVIGQSEYVIDCLAERLAVIAAGLPEGGDYADARAALNAAAGRLSELVADNQDGDFPASLTRSLRPDAPPASRPLRPVRSDNLAATLAAASGILAETQTQLLRSSTASSEAVHFQRIAAAVGNTNTILLRSS